MLLRNIKNVIKYAIELDIDYIETFLGYEGDNVLKITTRKESVIELLKTYLDNLGLEYKHTYELSGGIGGSYNIFVGVEDPSIFKLKRD
jgi:hypothetical protein